MVSTFDIDGVIVLRTLTQANMCLKIKPTYELVWLVWVQALFHDLSFSYNNYAPYELSIIVLQRYNIKYTDVHVY